MQPTYPNPAKNNITIEVDNFENAFIYNLTGQVVLQSRSKSIDVSNLTNGLYIIRVIANGASLSSKVIKE
ncbi:T9SS type A sorting domain-containing protein [Bacteroidota bacterium]